MNNRVVGPHRDLVTLRSELFGFNFEQLRTPLGTAGAMASLVDGGEYAAQIESADADRLASSHAVAAHVLSAVAAWAGLPGPAGGRFTAHATEAKLAAIVAALNSAEPEFASHGVRAFAAAPMIYASRDADPAWANAAHLAGLGRHCIHPIATDGAGRMDVHALLESLTARRGAGPVMIVATAGTANAGMVDPLIGCADIARAFGCWMHVDLGLGGNVIVSDRLRPALDGMARADSMTIDADDFFGTATGGAIVLAREASALAGTKQGDDFFAGLPLFLTLAARSWNTLGGQAERTAAIALLLRETMAAQGWWSPNAGGLSVVCLDPPVPATGDHPVDLRGIAHRAAKRCAVDAAVAAFEGRDFIRIRIPADGTTETIRGLASELGDALAAAA